MKKLLHRLGAYVLTVALTAGSVLAGFEGSIVVHASDVERASVITGIERAALATGTDATEKIVINNLKATPVSTTSIKLTWDADSNATGYRVYSYDSTSGKWFTEGVTAKPEFTIDTFETSATTYKMAVEAYREIDGANVTISDKTQVSSVTLPAKVESLSVVNKYSTTSTFIKWSKVSRAEGYVIYRYNTSKKSWTEIATTTGTTYENKKLSSGKGYTYMVKAYVSYGGNRYVGAASSSLKTATSPKSVSSAIYLEKEVLTKTKSGDYKLLSSDAGFSYIHGYKINITKVSGATGYIIYYQDVKDRSDASISKAKKLKSTKSTTISLSRTKKKGYERVFWVSTYYVYNGKTYINPSKTPITFGGTQYIYRNTKSKITQIKEEVYGAVDGQISIMRYYTAAGKLNKYQKYAYDKYGFITKIKTYNAAGKLIKTEKWR